MPIITQNIKEHVRARFEARWPNIVTIATRDDIETEVAAAIADLAQVDELKKILLVDIFRLTILKGDHGPMSTKQTLTWVLQQIELCFTQDVLDSYTEEELLAIHAGLSAET